MTLNIVFLRVVASHLAIAGLEPSPFANGVFGLELTVSSRYPFEPPMVKFKTKLYHPNIDAHGRICLDVLKMPPKGTWNPSFSLVAVLQCIQLLLLEPNPDDPLDSDIAYAFKYDYPRFEATAKQFTRLYAFTALNECTDDSVNEDSYRGVSVNGWYVTPDSFKVSNVDVGKIVSDFAEESDPETDLRIDQQDQSSSQVTNDTILFEKRCIIKNDVELEKTSINEKFEQGLEKENDNPTEARKKRRSLKKPRIVKHP